VEDEDEDEDEDEGEDEDEDEDDTKSRALCGGFASAVFGDRINGMGEEVCGRAGVLMIG
jgi:hypothetical protein